MKTDYDLNSIENSNILLLLQAAKKLGIAWTMVDDDRYQILLEKAPPPLHDLYARLLSRLLIRKLRRPGNQLHEVTAHSFRLNSLKSIRDTKNKYRTYRLLKRQGIPVLPKLVMTSESEYLQNFKQIPFPQVIKPIEGEKGEEVYLNIPNQKVALSALRKVLSSYPKALVEPYFPGHDIRIMTLDYKVIGMAERHPPEITGDGKSTLAQLIEQENQRRSQTNEKTGMRMLNRFFKLDRIVWYLAKQGLTLNSVLPKGKTIKLHELPNYSAGGWVSTLEKNEIHPSFLALASQVSRLVGLTIMGMDLLVKDLKQPSQAKGWSASGRNCVVLELNSDPGLRLHDLPNQGQSQHVSEKVLKFILNG